MKYNLKRWSSLFILIVFLTVGVSSTISPGLVKAAVQSSFPDVKNDNVHVGAIEYMKSQGIVSGYPDGTFLPDKTINRAEALKLAFSARDKLGITDDTAQKTINFPDVKSSDWYYNYVQKAFSMGVVEGYTDGKFKPANDITAAESLKIVLLAMVSNYQNPTVSAAPFTDVQTSQWVAGYAAYAKDRQLIEAAADGSFSPDRKMTRAEFAELLYRTYYSVQNKLDKFPISMNWAYCNNYQLAYKVKFPNEWQKILAGDQMIFWKKDVANAQVSFARVYPNSAVVVVAVDKNPQKLSLQKYLDTLEYGQGSNKQVITLNGLPYASIFVEQSGLQDSYFEMPNGQILVLYGQVGDGTLSSQLKEEIRYMIGSVRDSSGPSADASENCMDKATTSSTAVSTNTGGTISNNDQVISDIMAKVLVSGAAQSALDRMPDKIILSTDTIGIGTGPVDYYYSAGLDLTLKVERNSKTILATKKTKTSAF